MSRSPLGGPALVALALVFTFTQAGPSQSPPNGRRALAEATVVKVHPISDLGDAAELADSLADMIQDMIEPDSWDDDKGPGKIDYFAPGRALVVCNTPAVQSRIEALLNELRQTMPTGTGTAARPAPIEPTRLVPAQALVPTPTVAVPEPGSPMPYPVPTQAKQPKHLFHFIIRYEGEGFIDSNVIEAIKLQQGGSDATPSPAKPAPAEKSPTPASPDGSTRSGSASPSFPGYSSFGAISARQMDPRPESQPMPKAQ